MNLGRVFGIAVAAWLVTATVAQAAGTVSFSGFGGVAAPTGDFSDPDQLDAGVGFQVGGAMDFLVTDHFGVGLDGSWSRSTHGAEGEVIDFGPGLGSAVYDKDKFTTSQFGLHAKYHASSTGPFRVFGLVGLGMYKITEKWEGTISPGGGGTIEDNDEASTDSRLGYRFGAGATHAVSDVWGVGVEGDYNVIPQDEDEVGVSSLQYMSLRAVLTVTLPR